MTPITPTKDEVNNRLLTPITPTLTPITPTLQTVTTPVLILNGKADAANQRVEGLLKAFSAARSASCEGDHHSAPYQPTFQQAVVKFLQEQWRGRESK